MSTMRIQVEQLLHGLLESDVKYGSLNCFPTQLHSDMFMANEVIFVKSNGEEVIVKSSKPKPNEDMGSWQEKFVQDARTLGLTNVQAKSLLGLVSDIRHHAYLQGVRRGKEIK